VVSPDRESARDELESERGEGRRRLMMMMIRENERDSDCPGVTCETVIYDLLCPFFFLF